MIDTYICPARCGPVRRGRAHEEYLARCVIAKTPEAMQWLAAAGVPTDAIISGASIVTGKCKGDVQFRTAIPAREGAAHSYPTLHSGRLSAKVRIESGGNPSLTHSSHIQRGSVESFSKMGLLPKRGEHRSRTWFDLWQSQGDGLACLGDERIADMLDWLMPRWRAISLQAVFGPTAMGDVADALVATRSEIRNGELHAKTTKAFSKSNLIAAMDAVRGPVAFTPSAGGAICDDLFLLQTGSGGVQLKINLDHLFLST